MKRFSKFIQESVEIEEAVEVSHDRYMRSHGKKASGGHGTWMFTHKSMGDVDVNKDKEVHAARGNFSDAKKSAQQWAKRHGHSTVYVMEEVELEEEQSNWMVHVHKPVNKLKQGKTVTVKARNSAEAIRKGAIKHGDESARHGDFLRAEKIKEEVELDEERKSSSYQFTHKPGDAASEKKLADLKQSVKGTGKRVVLQGRLGKDNPNAHKYSKDAPSAKYIDGKRVNSDVSGKSGGHSHQRIQKADASHHDVYVYNRNESVEELDELKKSTLGSYVKKASSDMANNAYNLGARDPLKKPGSWDKAFKRKAGIEKATDRLAKEEVEQIDELDKKTLGSYIKKASGNMAGNAAVAAAQASSSMKKSSPETKRNITNRMKGIARATDKLTKEEVEQLDELSPDTLSSYSSKANIDASKARSHMRVSAGGKDFATHKKRYDKRTAGAVMAGEKYRKLVAREEVELDEVSDKKLDAYRQKAFADQPSGDDGSDKYRKRKFGRDLAFAKQTGRAKVRATKEEVDINEASDLRVTKVYNKFPKKATYAVHTLDRKYYKEFDTEADAKKHLETKK